MSRCSPENHIRFTAAGADRAPEDGTHRGANEPYESKIRLRHWSVNQTTLAGLLLDLSENGGCAQLSGDEIAESVLDLLRREFPLLVICQCG